jgi:hypothetical protein
MTDRETAVPLVEFDEDDLAEFVTRLRGEHDARTEEEANAITLAWHRAAPGRHPERFVAAAQAAGCSAVGLRRPR